MKAITLATRRYFAHVPRRLKRNPALVVALHAGAQTPEGFERMTGWSTIATREKFVVVYPEGIGRSWNAGHGALGEAGRDGVDDRGLLDLVIGDARSRWGCDLRRVYLSGFSNGSMLAHWYAAARAPSVAAIACVSGGFSRLPDRGTGVGFIPSVRMVHGTNDDHVPFAGGVGDAQIPGGWYDHLPIEDTAAWWSKQGADVATVWRSGGHVWPAGEAEMQWAWMRGIK
jgi:polyhydroxybutyrate depolymerase